MERRQHSPEERKRALDEALDAGGLEELPPNRPKGILGEPGFDLYKVDEFEPDLNAGVSQENDLPVVWLAVLVSYLLLFPVAFWIVWRTPLFSRGTKIVLTVAGALGVCLVVWRLCCI